MTITKADIKLFQSERMNDDPDGGGYMTDEVIQSGVENNVFPDISEVDRAQGAVDYRKFYLAVTTDDSDTYLGAHLILDEAAADTTITGLVVPAESFSEDRHALISRLNSDHVNGDYYGIKPLDIAGAVNDRTVKVDGVGASLIPTTSVDSPVSGAVIASQTSESSRTALIPCGSRIAVANGIDANHLRFWMDIISDTIIGSYDFGDGVVLGNADLDGVPKLTHDGNFVTEDFGAVFPFASGVYRTLNIYSTVTADYQPGIHMSMPAEVYEYTFTVGMSQTQFITLPYGSERLSEQIEWTTEGGGERRLINHGGTSFEDADSNAGNTAFINRTTHQITAFFAEKPKVGTVVRVRYVRAGYAQNLDSGALGGPFSGSVVTVTPTSGWRVASAVFKISTDAYSYYSIDPQTYAISRLLTGAIVGNFDPSTSQIQIIVPDGTTISEWRAVETNMAFPATAISDAQLEANIIPATLEITGTTVLGAAFTLTCDASGTISGTKGSGTYDKTTGLANITFTEAVQVETLAYSGTKSEYTAVPESVAGVNPAYFPINGEVPIFRVGDLVVVHNTQPLAPQTVTNGQVVDCGRTRVSDVRVFGNDGLEILAGFSFARATGLVTFSDVTGYSQPVTITHRVEDMATIIDLETTGLLTLSRGLTHVFPDTTSFVSSVLFIGDMQGRAHQGFQFATWTNVWADDLTGTGGTAILADYNEAAQPIVVHNRGAITERWLVQFTNTTAFKVIGEQVGQIAIGDTATDCSPVNPATGTPYFTIPGAGWGGNWAVGNCYRFNTTGGAQPAWVIRSIQPSDPGTTQDHITVAGRGSINA